MNTCGILYVATGKKYVGAAIQSAYSVKKHSPDLPTHLFFGGNELNPSDSSGGLPFTSVARIEKPHRRSKLDYLPRSPFERTLYLDTDTRLNADVRDIFPLLDRFDIALCHAHRRNAFERSRTWQEEIPRAFPQFNSGVILYRNSLPVKKLLLEWAEAYNMAGFPQDQTTLRELLWQSQLQIATLPPEYNLRFIKYHLLWGKSEAATQIFHLAKYHNGPFWFVKRWIKSFLRPFLRIPFFSALWQKVKRKK